MSCATVDSRLHTFDIAVPSGMPVDSFSSPLMELTESQKLDGFPSRLPCFVCVAARRPIGRETLRTSEMGTVSSPSPTKNVVRLRTASWNVQARVHHLLPNSFCNASSEPWEANMYIPCVSPASSRARNPSKFIIAAPCCTISHVLCSTSGTRHNTATAPRYISAIFASSTIFTGSLSWSMHIASIHRAYEVLFESRSAMRNACSVTRLPCHFLNVGEVSHT